MKNQIRSALLACAVLLGACAKEPDEAQIRAQIETQETSAEAGEISTFMESIAPEFSGQRGQFDGKGLRDLMRVQLLANTRLSVLLTGIEISVNQDSASARFNALVTGGAGLIPANGEFFKVTTDWRKIDGEWRVIAAQWEGTRGSANFP